LDKKNIKGEVIDFIKDLIIIGIFVLVIRTFIAEPFQISGQSMYNSFYNKEFIIVDRFSYLDIPKIKTWVVNRWDVVVVKPWVDAEKEYFLKRVIGLPGETVKIKDGEVYIKKADSKEFTKLDEKYLNKENKGHTKVGNLTKQFLFKVPEGKYFVMWDNRNHSTDARVCFRYSCDTSSRDAYIDKKDIVWKVFIDLGYFNFRNFSFKNSGSSNFPETKWIDTTPRWLSSPSTATYE